MYAETSFLCSIKKSKRYMSFIDSFSRQPPSLAPESMPSFSDNHFSFIGTYVERKSKDTLA